MVKSSGVSGHSYAGEREQAGARKRRKPRRLSPRLHITLPPEIYWKAKERWDNVSRVVASLLEVALSEDLTVEEVVTAVTLIRSGALVVNSPLGAGVAEPGQRRWTQDALLSPNEGLSSQNDNKEEPNTDNIFTRKALVDSTAKIHYGRDRQKYAEWVKRRTPSMAKKYIPLLDKYLWGKKANTPEELRKIIESIPPTKKGNPNRHAYLAIRSYINFLVDTGRIRKSEAIDFKAVIPNIKTNARAESAKVITSEDIREMFSQLKGKNETILRARKLYLKLLAFTGLRGDEVRELMNQFDPRVVEETFKAFGLPEEWRKKIAVYDMERVKLPTRRHGTKRGYVAVFPAELVRELEWFASTGYKLTADNSDKHKLFRDYTKVKDLALLRKFWQNFMNDNVMSTVPNPPADAFHLIEFLQGRAPKTVGGRNYRWNVRNAVRIYYYMVDRLKEELGILEL